MRPILITRLIVIGVGCWLLGTLRAEASSISINNIREDAGFFDTLVTGSVGFISNIHFLVDIPNTPWESSSTISEATPPAPLLPDILGVKWTIEHLVGPDPQDQNPNPLGPTNLALTFIPTVAGAFGEIPIVPGVFSCRPLTAAAIFTTVAIGHPLVGGGTHFDEYCLAMWGNVSTGLLGNLVIDAYNINYVAIHCDVLDPRVYGCAPTGPGGIGGMNETPEPATLVLFGSGILLLARKAAHTRRRRER